MFLGNTVEQNQIETARFERPIRRDFAAAVQVDAQIFVLLAQYVDRPLQTFAPERLAVKLVASQLDEFGNAGQFAFERCFGLTDAHFSHLFP